MSILRRPSSVVHRRRCKHSAVAILLTSLSLQACEKPQAPESTRFSAGRLPATQAVTIDASLEEWGEHSILAEITPAEAGERQWREIRGNAPASVGSNDFGMRVHMAHDASAWYIGFEIRDDAIVNVAPSSEHPYSGDSLEVFFVGSELDSGADFHEHVEAPRTPNQRAFFQLVVPPVIPSSKSVLLPAWRTDPALRRYLLNSTDFSLAVGRTAVGWNGEVRIPLAAFDESVTAQIRGRSPLRLNIDYLDYDSEVASRTDKSLGFKPDNVFCRCANEDDVNVPRMMPVIVFE